MKDPKHIRKTATVTAIGVLCLLWLLQASAAPQPRAKDTQAKGRVVYVCSCLKTRSCSCMTEAKTEGPCSCGTSGGPPMKAVPRNSAWAKANRRALAQ